MFSKHSGGSLNVQYPQLVSHMLFHCVKVSGPSRFRSRVGADGICNDLTNQPISRQINNSIPHHSTTTLPPASLHVPLNSSLSHCTHYLRSDIYSNSLFSSNLRNCGFFVLHCLRQAILCPNQATIYHFSSLCQYVIKQENTRLLLESWWCKPPIALISLLYTSKDLTTSQPNIIYDTDHPVHSKLQKIGKEIVNDVKPKAVVVISAHWESSIPGAIEINSSEKTDLIYEYVSPLHQLISTFLHPPTNKIKKT